MSSRYVRGRGSAGSSLALNTSTADQRCCHFSWMARGSKRSAVSAAVMTPRVVMRRYEVRIGPARPELPLLIKAPPGSRGAAAPTTGQSARLGKEQPGETHALSVAHYPRPPLTARHARFGLRPALRGLDGTPASATTRQAGGRGHITRAGAFPATLLGTSEMPPDMKSSTFANSFLTASPERQIMAG